MEMLNCLRDGWSTCTRCGLHETRQRVVFGSGSPRARLMVVGEAPGANEDEAGVPFVGQAGKVLDEAIRQAHLVRRQLFITNTILCRPPGNRDPLPEEQHACWQRLLNTIDVVDPGCLLLVGKPAAQLVLGREVLITKERGTGGQVTLAGRNFEYVLALHPSYIMRQKPEMGGTRMRRELSADILKAWNVAMDAIPF